MTKINPPVVRPKVIVIVGPTASGKSDLSIELAKKLTGEIISADSRQVYYGMNLGTGKVPRDRNPKSQAPNHKQILNSKFQIPNQDYYSSGIRHHLIDVASPKKVFTASDFEKLADKAIKEILAKSKVPIIVGGTGFYIDILLGRMQTANVPPNKHLRGKLEKMDTDKLFKKLKKLDPKKSEIIDRYNTHRLIRALEIVITTKKSSIIDPRYEIRNTKYNVLWLGLNPASLQKKIKKRLNARLNDGLVQEVKRLHEQGVSWKQLDAFGLEYRWISRYIKNQKSKIKIDEEGFKKSEEYQRLLTEIIKYSKRQMTWFKKNKEIHWLANHKTAEQLTKDFLS